MYNAATGSRNFLYALWFLILFLSISLPAAASPQAPANTDAYVGADTCGACHPDQLAQFRKTSMAVLLTEKYPVEQRGCEACHGPGAAHAEAMGAATDDQATERGKALIYSFARHSPKENAARCQACHQKDEKQSLFGRSRHLGAGVSCEACHAAHRLSADHEPATPAGALESQFSVSQRAAERQWLENRLLRDRESNLCYSCHRETQAQFQLPVRHRVNEGLVRCSDCHNPHGGLTARELRSTGTEACNSCHVEKKGPFVYEHASVRVEGCTACHTPHGSIHRHLLTRRQGRQLCLECHAPPEQVVVLHPRASFFTLGECTRCHVAIHGSNSEPNFLR